MSQKLHLLQGFIQAHLLTSVFHEGLSFMVIGHETMCISTVDPGSWGFIWGAVKPWGPEEMPMEALAILLSPVFIPSNLGITQNGRFVMDPLYLGGGTMVAKIFDFRLSESLANVFFWTFHSPKFNST